MNTNLNNVYIADAYYRLSKEDGDKAESDSIVNQKALIKEFLRVHPDIQIYGEKVDDGYTGVNFKRPVIQSLKEQLKEIEEAQKSPIVFDEDCKELSPAMMKAFKSAVVQRNRKKKA